MRFKGLDLNLLVALDALLTTRSVARASEWLCLSQPATSAALARLRDYFADPLLVAEGRRFHLTAIAETLLPLARQCLGDADAMIAATQTFDPATSRRSFRIVASDYMTVLVLTRLATHVAADAPGIILDLMPPQEDAARLLRDGSIDLLIGPAPFVAVDQPSDMLFTERHVVVGWSGNPIFRRPLTIDDLRAAGHVVATFGPRREQAFGDQHLTSIGLVRRIDVRVASFASLPWFLPGTMRLALMHERLARHFARVAPLSIAALPVAIPDLTMVQQYHRTRADDAGLSWLRATIRSMRDDASTVMIDEINGIAY